MFVFVHERLNDLNGLLPEIEIALESQPKVQGGGSIVTAPTLTGCWGRRSLVGNTLVYPTPLPWHRRKPR